MRTALSLACLLALLAAGCSESQQKAGPPVYSEKEKPIVRAAQKAVMQFEDWADRAEFKLQHKNGQWHVTAWRLENPEAKGNLRYVPWGRREISMLDAGKVLSHANHK